MARITIEPGTELLDVGTGSGGNIAIPAAQRGAKVVGVDLTPELFEHARRRAAEAGVAVEWVEGDAQDLPFADASFDRRFNGADDGTVDISSDYLVITVPGPQADPAATG